MSRDFYYLVPSESDGRNDQQQQQQQQDLQQPHQHQQQQYDESNASTTANDDESVDDDSARIPFIKERVYFAAKDGLPIALLSLLSSVENEATKNAYINQVSVASIS